MPRHCSARTAATCSCGIASASVLRVVAVSNFPPEMLGLRCGSPTAALAGDPPQQAIEVEELRRHEHRGRALDRYSFGSVLCAPLLFRGAAIGAINVHAGAAGTVSRRAPPTCWRRSPATRRSPSTTPGATERGEPGAGPRGDEPRADPIADRPAATGRAVLLDAAQAGSRRCWPRISGAMWSSRTTCTGSSRGRPRTAVTAGAGCRIAPAARARGPEPFSRRGAGRRDVAGHLLLSSDEDLGPIDRALVDAATTGVALEFAKVAGRVEVEERLRGEAATDLLTGTYASEEAIAARAARLGYDLGRAARPAGHRRRRPRRRGRHGRRPRAPPPRRSRDVARATRWPRRPAASPSSTRGSIVVLAARRPAHDAIPGSSPRAPGRIAGRRRRSRHRRHRDRCARPDDYAPAFRLARESVELMVKLGRGGASVGASELGPYGLLLRASSRDDLEAFAAERCGRSSSTIGATAATSSRPSASTSRRTACSAARRPAASSTSTPSSTASTGSRSCSAPTSATQRRSSTSPSPCASSTCSTDARRRSAPPAAPQRTSSGRSYQRILGRQRHGRASPWTSGGSSPPERDRTRRRQAEEAAAHRRRRRPAITRQPEVVVDRPPPAPVARTPRDAGPRCRRPRSASSWSASSASRSWASRSVSSTIWSFESTGRPAAASTRPRQGVAERQLMAHPERIRRTRRSAARRGRGRAAVRSR